MAMAQRCCCLELSFRFWQDLAINWPLMEAAEIHAQCHMCWNFRSQPHITTWLSPHQSSEDESRLHAVGNMVLPKCARLALHVMLFHFRSVSGGASILPKLNCAIYCHSAEVVDECSRPSRRSVRVGLASFIF